MRVLIAAGGTGGHILPGVAIAKVLRERGHWVHFVVKKDRDSQPLLSREGFPSSAFYFEGFPRTLSWRALLFPFTALAALLSARRVVRRESPDVCLGMGGYITVPVGLGALWRGVPLVLHEQNVRAGLANRFLSRWAKIVATSFDPTEGLSSRSARVVRTGLPLRPDLVPIDPATARRSLGLDPDAFTLLVFGGSQGARALNARMLEVVKTLAQRRPTWQYIHLTGNADEANVRAVYSALSRNAFVRAFYSDMATVYSAADFVVARAGANTVMEIRRMGRAALLVPFPFATNDHQTANARFLEHTGTARVIFEKDLTVDAAVKVLDSLSDVHTLRSEAKERLAQVGGDRLTAAERVADLIAEAK
jgi:UDP-N-acetylglucosamine--N-acetylmuramyl-(pentapeptide) pyrophosphoryl-undecaprenol N-acetylglucosamine transferase